MARVDISKIKNLISKEDFNLISEQRARATEVTRILGQPLPKIDFNAYKKILVNQSILNQVSEAVSGFKPEKPEIDSVLTSLDEQKVEALKAASKTVEAVEQSVSEFKTNLESIQSLPHYDNLTVRFFMFNSYLSVRLMSFMKQLLVWREFTMSAWVKEKYSTMTTTLANASSDK